MTNKMDSAFNLKFIKTQKRIFFDKFNQAQFSWRGGRGREFLWKCMGVIIQK